MPPHLTITPAAPPYVDCIQWVPRRFAGGVSPVTLADLVFTQRLLREVQAQFTSAPESPVLGAIVGQVFEDPTCARRWARGECSVVSAIPVEEQSGVEALAEAMAAIRSGLDGHTVIGWYRTHVQAGLYLSPEEAQFHEEYFRHSWEFALILAGTGDRLAGGVFQRTDPEGLSRSVYAPFYELTDEDPGTNTATRQTRVSWANYQTNARVIRPGEVELPLTVATIMELAEMTKPDVDPGSTPSETASETPSSEPIPLAIVDEVEAVPIPGPRLSPAIEGLPLLEVPAEPSAAEIAAEKQSAEKYEAEWEKIQIHRSLTAVGRSLGPGTLGQLGAPAPESPPEDRSEEAPETDAAEATRPTLTVVDRSPVRAVDSDGADASSRSDVIPIGAGAARPSGAGLVGGTRRRRRIPVAKIAMAVTGVALAAGAGWIGTHTRGNGSGGDDGGSGAAVAGLSLAPSDLFGTGERDEEVAAGSEGSASGRTAGADAAAVDGLAPLTVGADSEANDGAQLDAAEYEGGGAPPIPAPEPPKITEPPALDSLSIADPASSAYENASSIFKTEFARYEEVRRDFDEGLATCNPLNMAYRGVLESKGRLERRYADVEPSLTGVEQLAHRTALRQFALTQTHYELTDCPPLVGG